MLTLQFIQDVAFAMFKNRSDQQASVVPKMPDLMLQSARTMRKHYIYSVMVGMLLLLIIVAIFAVVTVNQFRAKTQIELATRGAQLQIALNQNLDIVQSHVADMSGTIAAHLKQPSLASSGALQFLRQQSPNAPPDAPWDNLPDNLKAEVGSLNINPSIKEPPERFQRDLTATLSMMRSVVSVHTRHHFIEWSYFYNASRAWWLLYPSQPRATLLKVTGKDSMTDALNNIFDADGTYPLELAGPVKNPSRSQVWTRPYLDVSGTGMMVTLLEPVYLNDDLVGVACADVTLNILQENIRQFPLPLGRTMIINAEGDLIGDSGGSLNKMSTNLPLREVLPEAPIQNLLNGSDNEFSKGDAQWISYPLHDTKWRLVLFISDSEMNHLLMNRLSPYLLLSLGFLVALIALAFIQSRSYTQPALRLAEFVDEMALDANRKLPQVPSAWQHWFERVANTARERESYLQETLKYASELEDKVFKRTEQLQAMNLHLEQTLTQLQSVQKQVVQNEKLASLGFMVAGVAHEMNTPIGIALLAATTLCADAKLFSAKVREQLSRKELIQFLENIVAATDLLEKNIVKAAELVNRFKQVSADRVSEDRREFNLAALGREIKTSVEPLLNNNNIEFELDIPGDITLDSFPDSLAQVMMILVSNAMIHAFVDRPGGRITWVAETGKDGSISITLADDGCGMHEDMVKHVFDPFYTTTLGKGGSGLGMYIAFNVIHKILGGEISVDSAVGQGTKWELKLPRVVL